MLKIVLGLAAVAAGVAGLANIEPSVAGGTALVSAAGAFEYQGLPIHPKLVEEFEGSLADAGPAPTVTVDVAAAFDTNEYAEAVDRTATGLVKYASPPGWYGYAHLGTLDDGTHVLRTASNGGGSGVFTNLMFVRLDSPSSATDPTGSRFTRVLMHHLGSFPLGDRDDGVVRVEADHVIVGASRYRVLSTTLRPGR
jgi:hypothetical protein